ncbi:hypothetical protein M9Y10_045781 [Tritrichomonas musculus]|uniref:Importin N-terminal domain-containing protein n=1 Tax=Tritrichomonas musculus TaxID=1915356 RepID=A0ABR2JWD2_9EUKA
MNVQNIEYIFSLSLQNDEQAIREAERNLLEFIQSPESIQLFLQIIQSSSNQTYISASFIYLQKAIELQWSYFTQEEKANLETILLNLYFQNQVYKKSIIYLLHFFLKNSDSLDSFLPFLTKEITPENIFDMINFYSIIIEFLPLSFLNDQKSFIVDLISKSFNLTKPIANDPNITEVKISTFRISTTLTVKLHDSSIVLPQIDQIGQILLSVDLSDSDFTMILALFKIVMPCLLSFSEIQYFFYTICVTLAENKELTSFRRSRALDSIQYQIESGILEPSHIFPLINLSFDILISDIQNFDNTQTIMFTVIFNATKVISEEEIFSYISSIVDKSINTNSLEFVQAGIIIISYLMICCPNSFLENQEKEVQILSNFLNASFPAQIQLSVLFVIQQVDPMFHLFPIVFAEKLIPFIFFSTDQNICEYACCSFFLLVHFSTFNCKSIFQILWENRNEFMKRQPHYFMEALFQTTLGLDDLDQSIKQEILNLVMLFLNPDADTNVLYSALLLSISVFLFNEESNADIINRIYIIIENALKMQDDNLFKTVFGFLYMFITQLKYQSFEILKKFSSEILQVVLNIDDDQTLSVGASIVKYWDLPQIKPKIYSRLVSRMTKLNILFVNENSTDFSDDDDISSLYYKLLTFLVPYLEPSEANQIFNLCLKLIQSQYSNILPLLRELIANADPENYSSFISAFVDLQNKFIASKDYHLLSIANDLSSELFLLPSDESIQFISEFIENLKGALKDPQISFAHIDIIVGIFSDAVLCQKVANDRIDDIFMTVYSIVFRQPPMETWQNISYFINISFSNYPALMSNSKIQNSIQNFTQTLSEWLNSPSEGEFDKTDTNDNIASLLLTIISIAKLNSDGLIQMSLHFFPPHDTSETPSMAARIIEICQLGLSVGSCCAVSEAIVRFLTMGIKKKREVSIDESLVQSFVAILKQMLANKEIAAYIVAQFKESPEKIEYIQSLCS